MLRAGCMRMLVVEHDCYLLRGGSIDGCVVQFLEEVHIAEVVSVCVRLPSKSDFDGVRVHACDMELDAGADTVAVRRPQGKFLWVGNFVDGACC